MSLNEVSIFYYVLVLFSFFKNFGPFFGPFLCTIVSKKRSTFLFQSINWAPNESINPVLDCSFAKKPVLREENAELLVHRYVLTSLTPLHVYTVNRCSSQLVQHNRFLKEIVRNSSF